MALRVKLDDWIGTTEKLLGLAALLGGGVLACRKWLGRCVRAVRMLLSFGNHFGPDPAGAISRLLEDVQRSQGIAEVERRLIARHFDFAFYICGPDGQCIAANEVLCDMFGLDSTQFTGYGWLEAIVERESVHRKWTYAVKNGMPYNAEYTVHNHRTDEQFTVATEALTYTAHDGTVVCYVGYVRRLQTTVGHAGGSHGDGKDLAGG